MSSKRYPEEFKIEAVKQVTEKGHSVAEVATRLGTTTHSLYAWIKRYDPQQPKIIESNDPSAELAKLKKELQRHGRYQRIPANQLPEYLRCRRRCGSFPIHPYRRTPGVVCRGQRAF